MCILLQARTDVLLDPTTTTDRRRKEEDRALDHIDTVIQSLHPVYGDLNSNESW